SGSAQLIGSAGLRDTVVAIDAGHGGRDPGAIGPRNTYEKDITLAVAKKLYQRLSAQPGIKPVMVREDDVYVGLRERMAIARKHGADLFVSIHADAVKRSAAKGSSVYTLSMGGASSEAAAWLANSENQSAALYGEVMLDGMDDILSQTLLNLTQGSTMERSMEAGADILTELKTVGYIHKPSVEHAAFAVLKSPDIPSVLVETAFISNPEEEKRLKSAKYQEKLAHSIARGIVKYLVRRAPEGTYLAAQRRKQG
ncbi:MAG: N-acetylmuramoyl-L-alanine amidase, partial [Granulosicoccus sp.]